MPGRSGGCDLREGRFAQRTAPAVCRESYSVPPTDQSSSGRSAWGRRTIISGHHRSRTDHRAEAALYRVPSGQLRGRLISDWRVSGPLLPALWLYGIRPETCASPALHAYAPVLVSDRLAHYRRSSGTVRRPLVLSLAAAVHGVLRYCHGLPF